MTAAEDIFGRNEDMIFVSHYDSPLGMIYMAADDDVLKGVWFEGRSTLLLDWIRKRRKIRRRLF